MLYALRTAGEENSRRILLIVQEMRIDAEYEKVKRTVGSEMHN